ncbi:Glycosyltransferase involved in cell wall bisynthesis [Streptosporangium subroseum]|uniref:Glycosyltransferase involved in cell wall bisynthesis n=1 Tax=Streptosporangium subroseum TaxID=106412 RepID=A0A239NYW5_9ACTN|nr:glycosyltransferase family 4 protein [Streptosporangium subroseum]SNT59309.1 Glycosyltransferase involved in cell wall bisynthesis [Streptosporangium subroseum]
MADQGSRVAFVLGTSAGGVGRHVAMLAGGLVRGGHRVVVAGPPSTEEAFGFGGLGARFVPVPISDRPHPLNDLRAVRALRALRGAQAVHAHGLRAGALAALALTGTRTGLVVTLHNAATASGAIGAIYGVLERIVARRADRVLVVSPDLGERMTALGARHVEAAVVPAPAPALPDREPHEIREELGTGDRAVFLTVARLAQQKGLETLLDVAAALAAGRPPGELARRLVFLVAGEGPLREALQGRIDGENLPVRLLGNRDDVEDLLRVSRALVVPSRWEGQPLNVQEALRAGTPIIATAVGGIPGMVGDAGLLVPYGDVGAMCDAIGRVLADDDLTRSLAEAAARRGRELPGEERALKAVLAVYGAL